MRYENCNTNLVISLISNIGFSQIRRYALSDNTINYIDSIAKQIITSGHEGKLAFKVAQKDIKKDGKDIPAIIQYFEDTVSNKLVSILFTVAGKNRMVEDGTLIYLTNGKVIKYNEVTNSEFEHPVRTIYFWNDKAFESHNKSYEDIDAASYKKPINYLLSIYRTKDFIK